MFVEQGIPTVADYKPKSIAAEQWATGNLVPTFKSLHAYVTSDWCSQYFHNPETGPLGEGMVVVSTLTGELYKVKHGGEDCGMVPDKLYDAIEILKEYPALEKALEVFLALQKIVKAKYKVVEKPKVEAKKPAAAAAVDEDAEKAWISALTKEDSLDDQFARGHKVDLTKRLVNQVKSDLIKDYGVDEKNAGIRANKFVNALVAKLFGEWQKQQAPKE